MSQVNVIRSVLTGREIKAFDFSKPPKDNQAQKPEAVDSYSTASPQNQPVTQEFISLLNGRNSTTSK